MKCLSVFVYAAALCAGQDVVVSTEKVPDVAANDKFVAEILTHRAGSEPELVALGDGVQASGCASSKSCSACLVGDTCDWSVGKSACVEEGTASGQVITDPSQCPKTNGNVSNISYAVATAVVMSTIFSN